MLYQIFSPLKALKIVQNGQIWQMDCLAMIHVNIYLRNIQITEDSKMVRKTNCLLSSKT